MTDSNQAVIAKLLGGYSEAELQAAFSTVENKANWKLGNVARVALSDLDRISYAVTFYTGSVVNVVSRDSVTGFAWISFEGYYSAVGA